MTLHQQCPLFLSSINPTDYLRLNSAGTSIEGANRIVTADPSTLTEGDMWYNSTDHHWKGYNGTEIVLLG